jgi:GTP pyrophosphokinase
MVVELAEEYARKYHDGQLRKGTALPYVVHPENVVKLLKRYGVSDPAALAIAWLHDTVEDTSLTEENVREVFGDYIAQGVNVLTRNICRDEYNARLSLASKDLQMIKLCDTLDNIRTLECLSPKSATQKVRDCQFFFIPMALDICPDIAFRMRRYLDNYFKRHLDLKADYITDAMLIH